MASELRKVGPFTILSVLGRGGMGVVYRARDEEGRRDVALKMVVGAADSERLARFRREGEITASLRHPGIVTVHAAGEEGGTPFLAYELLEDCAPLDEAFRQRSLRDRVLLIRDAAEAVAFAHARRVVHRDLKPENVLVDAEGRVKIADFGLATAVDLETLTRSGALLGTPSHMSPEQLRGAKTLIGPPADVWALGVVLYQALTDELPYVAANFIELSAQIHRADPPAPRRANSEVARDLESVCARAMQVDANERYPDAGAFAADLDAWLEGRPVAAAPARAWARALRRRWLLLLPLVALVVPFALLPGQDAIEPSPAAEVDRLAPQVELRSPPDGLATDRDRVVFEGRIRESGEWVDLRVGGIQQRQPGDAVRFALEVPLEEGEHTLSLVVSDPSGNERIVKRRITRVSAPAWYRRLPSEGRPELPLPPGLVFGEGDGEYVNQRDRSILVWTPPGSFRMGRSDSYGDGSNEQYLHRVRLTQGFFLGKYEVTWTQYRRYVEAVGKDLPDPTVREGGRRFLGHGRTPVFNVNRSEVLGYCKWAGLRLPTEAEWEYAARGGAEERTFPWGPGEPKSEHANVGSRGDPHTFTAPVGSYPAGRSRWGCYDLVGNVTEWVADMYQPYSAQDQVDPFVERGTRGVGRGSDWKGALSHHLQATARFSSRLDERSANWGFRVCRSVAPDRRPANPR